ncbi:MAG: phenylalanine--tRNA ligase beta subunit-related protein [Chloroflexaceae bacterium]|jgi:DNA/RNA-binding domain of Phe-tRNA-synthetase-like protein|nr:phenylalanine--tRNA ligase beta subunit-related protein [Chloroflexaceae bacterium]
MTHIIVTDGWHDAFPGGAVGVLLVGNVDNTPGSAALEQQKRALEARLREQYAGYTRAEFQALPILQAYRTYYKQFDKTYHVQGQLESVVLNGKALPAVSPLVDVNFMAEMETLVLAAGHDADLLHWPLTIDATSGGERFTQLNGTVRTLKANDMMMADAAGIVCTIIYGQDARTPISPTTRRALYVAYAPAGVPAAAVQQLLDCIYDYIRMVAPAATVELRELFTGR